MNIHRIANQYQQLPENILMDIAILANNTPDLINLSLGDPDITTAEDIINAAFTDAKKGHTHYTASAGSDDLLRAIAKYYEDKHRIFLNKDQIIATVGGLHGLFLALRIILNPDDEVIIPEPYFSPYKEQVLLSRGVPVLIPTYEEDEFQVNIDVLKQAITDKTKAIIINSPNNPTGAVFSKETLQAIAHLAIEHNLYILSDEVYESFAFSKPFYPMIEFAPDHTLTFGSFSKAFAMTGWRIGYMIAPAYIVRAARAVNESIAYSAPTISQRAGIYALENHEELVPQVVQTFKERLDYIASRVDDIPFLSMQTIQGSIYAFINIKATNMTSLAFTMKLLKESQVLVVPGKAFGQAGEGYIRVAATQKIEWLKQAFDRIAAMDFTQEQK